jgi:hypothetical protein
MQHQNQSQGYQQGYQQQQPQQGYQQQGYAQQMGGRQPLDQGRVTYIAERYPSKTEVGQDGQPKMKNRYATLGRVTKWPKENGGENLQIQLDSVPVGHTGSLELFVFWDSEQQR